MARELAAAREAEAKAAHERKLAQIKRAEVRSTACCILNCVSSDLQDLQQLCALRIGVFDPG